MAAERQFGIMRIIGMLKKWISAWKNGAEKEFDIRIVEARRSDTLISACRKAYEGQPEWAKDGIRTVNLAETVCGEIARLAVMGTDITLTGSPRADYLQGVIDNVKESFRSWVEYGCAYGEIVLKPNGSGVDIVFPDRYAITERNGAEITGAVFIYTHYDAKLEAWYARMEYHRIAEGTYTITNKCYIGEHEFDLHRRIDIAMTIWAELDEEITAEGVEKMLFGYFRMPNADNIDPGSGKGMPVFANAMEELRDLDIAYSRNTKEIFDSKRTVLLDSDRLMQSGGKIGAVNKASLVEQAGLPDYVKLVTGETGEDVYHEINPMLETETRIAGINNLLSQIGFKCGFSNGYFVFDEKTGMVTATQVEADDRRTIQLINDVRIQFKRCISDMIEALNCFADAYGLAPRGTYETSYDFGDITYNYEEDKSRWFSYVLQGLVPAWKYFTKFEGMTEEDARAMVEEAKSGAIAEDPLAQLFQPSD